MEGRGGREGGEEGRSERGGREGGEEGRAERGGREGGEEEQRGEEGREGVFTSLLLLPDNNGGPQLTRIHLKACLYKLCQLHPHSHMEHTFAVQVPEKRDAH